MTTQRLHGAGTRATAFGLRIDADSRMPFLEATRARPPRRRLDLVVNHGGSAELDWPGSARVICSRRERDGPETFRIEAHPDLGYLICARAGSYLLSADGGRLRCAPGARAPGVWERFLIGQVLPFAALVSGLEILHASGVVLDGGAVAFAGPSGAGKTSIALRLCEGGASFLADDVLALEPRGDRLLAHPGTPLAAIDLREATRLHDAGKLPERDVLMGDPRERVVRVHGSADEAPLRALFFLDRRADGPRCPRFEPVTDPRTLLAATFNFALDTPERLRRLLSVGAILAAGHVERVVAGASVDASELAAAVQRRLSAPM